MDEITLKKNLDDMRSSLSSAQSVEVYSKRCDSVCDPKIVKKLYHSIHFLFM